MLHGCLFILLRYIPELLFLSIAPSDHRSYTVQVKAAVLIIDAHAFINTVVSDENL